MSSNAIILVVDDEPTSRQILVGYFESEGYLVREAQTAEQAEDILQKETIDLGFTRYSHAWKRRINAHS
ncbi:response regulator [Marinomonas sp. GJ51-6]|uniref:response regulator n=1 Tax=Marinomonas sp. GJ51-6 TaxID=2992802 RepID=UPI00293484F9|nr:response regulator [Marinomonas sp. GJ51-6]WOD08627.1 response regulator [Marinomonas sp. GJ51-6]